MSEAKGITVLAICGSLRAGSYNKAALRAAIEEKPPGMTIETADIGGLDRHSRRLLLDRGAQRRLVVGARAQAAANRQNGDPFCLAHMPSPIISVGPEPTCAADPMDLNNV